MAKHEFFEDYVVGETIEVGGLSVDAAELRAFAEAYDPQPIHLDPAAAAASPYGGIIASGWQTAGLTMRMVLEVVDSKQSLGSPGIGRLSWRLPVRAGDVLHVRIIVRTKRRSQSKPDRGLVTLDVDTLNQKNEVVMRAEEWIAIIRTRA